MAGTIEKKLADLGIDTRHAGGAGGQLCAGSCAPATCWWFRASSASTPRASWWPVGKLGGGVSVEDGQKAARACAINLLAQIKVALGDLDKVQRVVRLGGFINAAPDFLETPR